MDPITLGILLAAGASGAAAMARLRRRRNERETGVAVKRSEGAKALTEDGIYRVGDVLVYMGEEYWLAGELALIREGGAAMRVYSAPEKGKNRWVAAPRQSDALWVMETDEELAAMGWPGVEVPLRGRILRPMEQGRCAVSPKGEVEEGWEGVGRFAALHAVDAVALVIEQGRLRLALSGKTIPKAMIEKLG